MTVTGCSIWNSRIQIMRLAVLSDIHGNLTAFKAVLADLKSVVAPDLVVHGGDLAANGAVKSKTITYGHIHRTFIRKIGKRTIVNSGSVGLSYDGDQRASYVVIDPNSVTIRRV